jgi:hypothetical protein
MVCKYFISDLAKFSNLEQRLHKSKPATRRGKPATLPTAVVTKWQQV